MKIILPGGSGQVGQILARAFHRDGHEVVVLSRNPKSAPWLTVGWDGAGKGNWWEQLEGADVVINLAGRSVNCRYNAANRWEIMDSRVNSTRAVGMAIAAAKNPPHVWLQAGTATIYAHRLDAPNDDKTGLLGGNEPGAPDAWRFSIEVARRWEEAINEAATPGTRKVILRSAVTMSPDAGGIFRTMLALVRAGLGGSVAGGRQFMSWIHEEDFVSAIRWLIEHEELSGPVILAAPQPTSNAAFMRSLRQVWGQPIGLPATAWMVEIGAWLLRTESELVLKSRGVVPARLLESGFQFQYPEWPAAARELCSRVRQ